MYSPFLELPVAETYAGDRELTDEILSKSPLINPVRLGRSNATLAPSHNISDLPVITAPEDSETVTELMESEYHAGDKVVFPSGESLTVVEKDTGREEEHWDSPGSGNPLFDTSGAIQDKYLSKNFKVKEFARNKQTVARIDVKLVEALQTIRDNIGSAINITSGYRSYLYNKRLYDGYIRAWEEKKAKGERVGKKPVWTKQSRHIAGSAADFNVAGYDGKALAKKVIDILGCGNYGIGLGNDFIHLDVLRDSFAVWNYSAVPDSWITEIQDYYKSCNAPGGTASPKPGAQPATVSPDWKNAVGRNNYYRQKLGWGKYIFQINDLLLPYSGDQNVSLGEEAFAQAVAAWQRQQGFSAKDADGIIGPNTWRKMMPLIITPGTRETFPEQEMDENELFENQVTPVNPPACSVDTSKANKVGFEFDTLISITADLQAKTVGDKEIVSEHTLAADGFVLKVDGNKIEVSTKPFELSDTGLTDLNDTFTRIESWISDLKDHFNRDKKSVNIKKTAACTSCFSGSGIYIETSDVGKALRIKDKFITPNSHFIFPLKTAVSRVDDYFTSNTIVRGVPQTTMGVPLAAVNKLVDKIRSTENQPVGTGLSVSGSGWRLGLRSDALYNAQFRVNAARKYFLGQGTFGSLTINQTNFSDALAGFLILLVEYLWTSVLPEDPRDPEGFSKAYVPLHSKTRFREMFHCLLTDAERELFFKVFWEGDSWKNLFSLTHKIEGRQGGYTDINATPAIKLFPSFIVRAKPTWKEFVTSIVENNFSTEQPSGYDSLVTDPTSGAIPLTTNGAVLEFRRMGFGTLAAEKWRDMAVRLFKIAREINASAGMVHEASLAGESDLERYIDAEETAYGDGQHEDTYTSGQSGEELFTSEPENDEETATEPEEQLINYEFDVQPQYGTTDYLPVSVGKGFPAKTGVFIPANFKQGTDVNVVIFLHGHLGYIDSATKKWVPNGAFTRRGMDYYWKNYSNIREFFRLGNGNAILLAPTLGSHSSTQYGSLGMKNGFDNFVSSCFTELRNKKYLNEDALPSRIILAGHSGGGRPMGEILHQENALLKNIVEVWGFDCLYGNPRGTWVNNYRSWAKTLSSQPAANPSYRFYHYWAYTYLKNMSEPGKNGEGLQSEFPSLITNIAPPKYTQHRDVIGWAWTNEINNRQWFGSAAIPSAVTQELSAAESMQGNDETMHTDEAADIQALQNDEAQNGYEVESEELEQLDLEGHGLDGPVTTVKVINEQGATIIQEQPSGFEYFAPADDPILFYEDVKLRCGDTVIGLAAAYGFDPDDWREIWQDPKNAALVTKRKLSTAIREGDTLYIPIKWRITNKKLEAADSTFKMTAERSGKEGGRLSWVQTVYAHNQPNFPVKPFPAFSVDLPSEDDLPFYWTQREYDHLVNDFEGIPVSPLRIKDRPFRPAPAAALGTTRWRAVTSLCLVTDKRVSVWDTFVWGINFNVTGANDPYDIRTATKDEVQGHLNLLRKKTGKSGRTFTAMGWSFRDRNPGAV